MVLVVAEPSLSGISDMERILKTAETLGVKTAVCVNKADTNSSKSQEIREYCQARDIPFCGTMPFDSEVVPSINSGRSIVQSDCQFSLAVREVHKNIMAL